MPMRLCSKCGKENLNDARYCVHCGQTFAINKYVKCTNCGLLMDKEASYCMHCGHDNEPDQFDPRHILDKINRLELRVTQLEQQVAKNNRLD